MSWNQQLVGISTCTLGNQLHLQIGQGLSSLKLLWRQRNTFNSFWSSRRDLFRQQSSVSIPPDGSRAKAGAHSVDRRIQFWQNEKWFKWVNESHKTEAQIQRYQHIRNKWVQLKEPKPFIDTNRQRHTCVYMILPQYFPFFWSKQMLNYWIRKITIAKN